MNQSSTTNKGWIELLAAGLGAVAALVAIAGAMLVLSSQSAGSGDSIWPLPGFVMIDWVILGVLGFLAAYLGTKPQPDLWSKAAWFAVGALIPLMALGALSIGPYVLLSLVFQTASALMVTFYKRMKGKDLLMAVLLGIFLNAIILLGMIALGSAF